MESFYKDGKIVLPEDVIYRLENGIPKLEKNQLLKLYKKIKPIVTCDGYKYFLDNLSLDDLTSLSFLSLTRTNQKRIFENCERVNISNLEEVKSFICLHKYGFSLSFRPSVNEVLSQIPSEYIDEVQAFEIIEEPEFPFYLNRYTNKPYHFSKVMTYKKQG